jgi:competence protein ComEA
MRTDEPLANLHRRLGLRPEVPQNTDEEAEESEAAVEPSWLPEGLAESSGRGPQHWLTAIRADPGRAGGIALAVIAALAVLVTVFTLARQRPAPVASANLPPVEMVSTSAVPPAAQPAAQPSGIAAPQPLVISVVGLVQQPGLVTLAPDARVADAVSAAGGPLRGADTLGLNLARHLVDGEQIVVGIAAPAGQSPALGSSVGSATAPQMPAAPAKPVGPVDLNTATVEQLDALPGVGPVTAAAIVAWRTANGRFTAVDQLGEVDGIGPARLEKLRPLVRV